uniref:Uncharacterized protein n=1 Tax=Monopterus albus TaxID=43700 RepID=A0A3Q3JCS2_MONAL
MQLMLTVMIPLKNVPLVYGHPIQQCGQPPSHTFSGTDFKYISKSDMKQRVISAFPNDYFHPIFIFIPFVFSLHVGVHFTAHFDTTVLDDKQLQTGTERPPILLLSS